MKNLGNLVYKELRLAVWPLTWPFLITAALLLAPNYQSIVAVFYCLLSILNTFRMITVNKDNDFTMSLPVPRAHIVLAKHLSVAIIEVSQLIAAIPFALCADLVIRPQGNLVGIDANFAFFGFCLVSFAVFNLLFLPAFFKTAYKTGLPTLLGFLGFVLSYLALELAISILPPGRQYFDSLNPATFPYQLAVLCAGILFFTGAFFVSYKFSVKHFEKVSL
jgi:hypothetical protein